MHCTCLYCICCLHAQNVQPLQKEGHVPPSKLRLVHLVQAADASRLTKKQLLKHPLDARTQNYETERLKTKIIIQKFCEMHLRYQS